jgi:hypothetical protein
VIAGKFRGDGGGRGTFDDARDRGQGLGHRAAFANGMAEGLVARLAA